MTSRLVTRYRYLWRREMQHAGLRDCRRGPKSQPRKDTTPRASRTISAASRTGWRSPLAMPTATTLLPTSSAATSCATATPRAQFSTAKSSQELELYHLGYKRNKTGFGWNCKLIARRIGRSMGRSAPQGSIAVLLLTRRAPGPRSTDRSSSSSSSVFAWAFPQSTYL